jgi:hypothetical protein
VAKRYVLLSALLLGELVGAAWIAAAQESNNGNSVIRVNVDLVQLDVAVARH